MSTTMPAIYNEMASSDVNNPLPGAPHGIATELWDDVDQWMSDYVTDFYDMGFRHFIFHGVFGRNKTANPGVVDYNSWQAMTTPVLEGGVQEHIDFANDVRDAIHDFAVSHPDATIYIYVGAIWAPAMELLTGTERQEAIDSVLEPWTAHTDYPQPLKFIFDACWDYSDSPNRMTAEKWTELQGVWDQIGREHVWGEALPETSVPDSHRFQSMAIEDTYQDQIANRSEDIIGLRIRVGNGTGTNVWRDRLDRNYFATTAEWETQGINDFIADCKENCHMYALSPGEFFGYGEGEQATYGPTPASVLGELCDPEQMALGGTTMAGYLEDPQISYTKIYLDSTADGTGDGTEGDPYNSWAEMMAEEGFLNNNTIVYAKGIFFEDVDLDMNLSRLIIQRWPGEAQPKWRPVSLVTNWELHTSAGSSDVYRQVLAETEYFPHASVPYMVVDWETQDANGVYGSSIDTGFMELGANETALQSIDWGWFQQPSNRVLISVPKGVDPNDHTFYALENPVNNTAGHAWAVTGDIDDLHIDADIGLATKNDSVQQGNALDITGDFDSLTLYSPNLQGAWYHNFVTRGQNHGSITIDTSQGRGIIATSFGGNDACWVVYAGNSWTGTVDTSGIDCYGYAYTDVTNTPVIAGSITGFATHAASGVSHTGKQIIFQDCSFTSDPNQDEIEHTAFACIAGSIGHNNPSDRDDPDDYSVWVTDCNLDGKIRLGGGSGSDISVYLSRNKVASEFGNVSSYLSEAGHIFVTAPTGANTYAFFEHNVLQPTLPDLTNSALLQITGSGDEYLTFRYNSVRPGNTAMNINNSLVNLSTSAGNGVIDGLIFEGNLFDSLDDSIYLLLNGLDYLLYSTWTDNLYSANLNSTANRSFGSDILNDGGTRDMQEEVDGITLSNPGTTGFFEITPVYVNEITMEPDPVTRTYKSTTITIPERVGYSNNRLTDGTVGAWQYGLTPGSAGKTKVPALTALRRKMRPLRGRPLSKRRRL